MSIAHALCHMTCKVGGQKQPKIWKHWLRFAYSLYNFQGATMMIKGSLLCSVPTVKRFGWKFSKSKNGPKIGGFGGFGGEKF